MSKVDGFSRYTCDRCGKSVWAVENAPEVQSWRTVNRITADDAKATRLLCGDCASEYRTFAQAQDSAFGDFMTNKKKEA